MKYWLDRWATLILGNSNSSLEFGWKKEWAADPRCAVIHNGLDTSPFSVSPDPSGVRSEFGLPMNCPLVIHVGRMDPPKNHERLVEIWASLARNCAEAQFLSVGRIDPALIGQLRARLQATGLQNRVVWAGVREDVPRLLLAANLMYFPSRWEGLPGAVLEASAAGVPVIGSDIPPIREIASRVPTVKPVSLQESDERWAEEGLSALILQTCDRQSAREFVETSVYGIEPCLHAHIAAWHGSNGYDIRNIYQDAPTTAFTFV